MNSDHYRTPASRADAEIKIERSRFLGFVIPVSTEAEFASELGLLSKRFFDATHHCWAWRIAGDGDASERSSDAGEPHGTAGKPILSAIEGAGIFDVAVVVVRFYGGIKLGTGGLSRAYRAVAQAAIAETPVAERYLYTRFEVDVPFTQLNVIYRMVSPPSVVLVRETFGEQNLFEFDVRRSKAEQFSKELKNLEFRIQNSESE